MCESRTYGPLSPDLPLRGGKGAHIKLHAEKTGPLEAIPDREGKEKLPRGRSEYSAQDRDLVDNLHLNVETHPESLLLPPDPFLPRTVFRRQTCLVVYTVVAMHPQDFRAENVGYPHPLSNFKFQGQTEK